MPIKPKPLKFYCQKCGFEKTIQFKSDCLNGRELEQIPRICPKCGNKELKHESVEQQEFGNIMDSFKNIFK
ncbi:MAG: hypothetical protein ACTTH5_02820 [Wolinella sp.]